MTTSKTIVAGYIRVSTLDQGAESLPDQEKRIKDYGQSHGYSIFKIYSDKESGAEENRTAFQEMIRAAEQKKFSKIVFTQWDRFARDARDTLNYHHRMEKIGVALVCLALGIDTGTPEGKLVMTQGAAFSEYERKRIRERTTMGRRAKVRRREIIHGGVPFGYKWNKAEKKFEIVPDQQKIYLQIVDWILKEGTALEEINRRLQKIPYYFNTSKVSRIVKNPTYYGQHTIRFFDRVEGKRIYSPESEWVTFNVPPLISKKTWEQMNKKVQSRKSVSINLVQNQSLLWGLLECGHCGARLSSTSRAGGRYRYYECEWSRPSIWKKGNARGKPKRLKRRCSLPLINADKLEGQVLGEIYKYFQFPERIVKYWEQANPPQKATLHKEVEQLARRIAQEEAKVNRLLELYESTVIDRATLDKRIQSKRDSIQQWQEEKAGLEIQVKDFQAKQDSLDQLKKSIQGIRQYSGQILKAFDTLPIPKKREFLIRCLEGNRIPVRTLNRGDVFMFDGDADPKLKKKLSEPYTEKERGKEIIQVGIDTTLDVGGFLRGLDFLKKETKINFIGKSRPLGMMTGQFP